jgi:hypothetical protein
MTQMSDRDENTGYTKRWTLGDRTDHEPRNQGPRTRDARYIDPKSPLVAAAYDAFQNCSRFSQGCRAESPPTSR